MAKPNVLRRARGAPGFGLVRGRLGRATKGPSATGRIAPSSRAHLDTLEPRLWRSMADLMRRRVLLAPLALSCVVLACGEAPPPPPAAPQPTASQAPPPPTAPPAPPPPRRLSRAEFNRYAIRLNIPLFWVADANGDGVPQKDELKTLLFFPSSSHLDVDRAVAKVLAFDPSAVPAGLAPDEIARRKLVADDLDQGQATLIYNDLRAGSASDKTFITHMLNVAALFDDIEATMKGMKALASRVPADDLASQSLFRRDWGPACAGAKTLKDPSCTAISGSGPHPYPLAMNDLYPAAMQADPSFCAVLQRRPEAKTVLGDHFSVVRERNGTLVKVPYTEVYSQMNGIASELFAAAREETDPSEEALRTYLRAAATSFTTNDWGPADEAWSRMNAQNSKWYVRAAPDEVLGDPCNVKAQFHLNVARIDPGSVRWQSKLTPVEQDMEKAMAGLIGAPYVARKVTFHLPDFIQIVINAGEDRKPTGAIGGESLPNWGKVETEGRGRTVAMTNLGTDPDSKEQARERVESLLDKASAALWTKEDEPALLNTILHEATHNLGPTYTYVFRGKKGDAVFGGGLAAMLEELKAETGSMFYLDWLAKKGVVTPALERQSYAAWLEWCLRHISGGMHSGTDDQAYAQLAAIQVGFAMDEGALTWDATVPAANGKDTGAFTLHEDKLAPAFVKLMKTVATLKAKTDKPAADALVARFVDGPVVPLKVIAERELRFPQTTYVYAIDR